MATSRRDFVAGVGGIGLGSLFLGTSGLTADDTKPQANPPASMIFETVFTGIDSMDVLRQDLELVRNFKPLTREQTTALLKRTAGAAADGQYEQFKTGNRFDSTAQNPQWLG